MHTCALSSIQGETLSEEEEWRRFESFLKNRIEATERGEVITKTVTRIFEEVRDELRHHENQTP